MASHNADRKSEEIARVSLLIQSQHTRIALFCLQAGRKSEAAVCTKGHIKESAWSVGARCSRAGPRLLFCWWVKLAQPVMALSLTLNCWFQLCRNCGAPLPLAVNSDMANSDCNWRESGFFTKLWILSYRTWTVIIGVLWTEITQRVDLRGYCWCCQFESKVWLLNVQWGQRRNVLWSWKPLQMYIQRNVLWKPRKKLQVETILSLHLQMSNKPMYTEQVKRSLWLVHVS